MKGFLAFVSSGGGGNTGVAVGLPAGQNMVEGTEASIMTGAASANAGWGKTWIAAAAGLATLVPYLAGLWFLYKYEPGQYIDYAIAVLIFAIGIHEVKEGLEDKPKPVTTRDYALDGPLGIDPVDSGQIEKFQGEHGLEQDGVLGPRTRGAIVAELRRRNEEPRPNRLGVDVTDEESVRAFQRRVGLNPDGVVGPKTQGALAAEGAHRLPDPADPEDVRRFQHRFRLPESGVVDARTQGALQALRLEPKDGKMTQGGRHRIWPRSRASANGHAHHDDAQGDGVPRRPDRGPSAVYGLDLASSQEISRFQRVHGLPETGTVDARTQGALRAEIERIHRTLDLDPADRRSVSRFQAAHGLELTGEIDAPTQMTIRQERGRRGITNVGQRTVMGVDPTDAGSIKRFQALHGVEQSGEIDEDTQQQLRRTEEWTAGIDLTDPSSVAAFQAAHGLEPTGVVGRETQGVLRLYRTALKERHQAKETADADGWYPLDPTDADSIRSFQGDHGLEETGTIGVETQAAMRMAMTERTGEALRQAELQHAQKGGRVFGAIKEAWPAYLGVLFEGGEAGLFTIGVAHGTGSYFAAAVAGGSAFAAPWVAFAFLKDWIESWPNWLFELVIGVILASAATIFGLFRAAGIFG